MSQKDGKSLVSFIFKEKNLYFFTFGEVKIVCILSIKGENPFNRGRISPSKTTCMDLFFVEKEKRKNHAWPQKFHPNKNLPHDVISSFFFTFTVLTFGKDDLLLLCALRLLHDNGVNLKRFKILEGEILSRWLAPELWRPETGASFSTAPRGAVRLDRNRPQIWPTLSSPPSLERGQRIWFKMECFRRGKITSLQTQGKCQNKDGEKP